MEIQNRTPHAIALKGADGVTRIIPPTVPPARVVGSQGAQEDEVGGVPIHPSRYDHVCNLPDPTPGRIIVVSQITAIMVAAAQPTRTDVVFPATARRDGAVRDERGVLVVTRLCRAAI